MKVKELIALLRSMPENAEIEYDGIYGEIATIWTDSTKQFCMFSAMTENQIRDFEKEWNTDDEEKAIFAHPITEDAPTENEICAMYEEYTANYGEYLDSKNINRAVD